MDLKKNVLIVGEEKDLYAKEMVVGKVNWIAPLSLRGAKRRSNLITMGSPQGHSPLRDDIYVQIRYHHSAVPCEVSIKKNGAVAVKFKKPERAVTPGQTAVFYDGDQVLGGGIIKGSI